MKPNEFKDCTFKELKLYAQSFILQQEHNLKEQIILFENVTNKVLYNNPQIVKRPQKIKLVEIYKELFKEDMNKLVETGQMKPQSDEEQYKFVMELQEELKERGEL